jgi:hypothetical protein
MPRTAAEYAILRARQVAVRNWYSTTLDLPRRRAQEARIRHIDTPADEGRMAGATTDKGDE